MTAYYGQNYPRRPFYYATLPQSSKLLISCFFLAMTFSIGLSVMSYHLKTKFDPKVAAYVIRGNEGEDQSSLREFYFAKSKQELAEVSHPHIFIQGLLIFILAHLFTLTQIAERRKGKIIVLSFGSYLLGIAAPWLIRFVTPWFSYVQIVNLFVFAFLIGYLMAVPFAEMWGLLPSQKRDLKDGKEIVHIS